MELKEVVNLRKLYEEFFDTELSCEDCPFSGVCGTNFKSDHCFVGHMVSDQRDLYDLEGELDGQTEFLHK